MNVREIIVTEEDGSKKSFTTKKEVCEYYKLSRVQLDTRLMGMVKNERRKFGYGRILKGLNAVNKSKVPFNPKGFPVVAYEAKFGKVCITECVHVKDKLNEQKSKFFGYEHVMIGSALCKMCSSHAGQDSENQLVACKAGM